MASPLGAAGEDARRTAAGTAALRCCREVVYQGVALAVRFSRVTMKPASGLRFLKVNAEGGFFLDKSVQVRKIEQYLFILVNIYSI